MIYLVILKVRKTRKNWIVQQDQQRPVVQISNTLLVDSLEYHNVSNTLIFYVESNVLQKLTSVNKNVIVHGYVVCIFLASQPLNNLVRLTML